MFANGPLPAWVRLTATVDVHVGDKVDPAIDARKAFAMHPFDGLRARSEANTFRAPAVRQLTVAG